MIFDPRTVGQVSSVAKTIDRVSRDKILHDSWSISPACPRVFSAPSRHLENGVDPGNEVQ